MSETWEETKARYKKLGVGNKHKAEPEPELVEVSAPRYDEFAPKPITRQVLEDKPKGKRYNIHKRSLPIGIPPMDKIVFFNVSKNNAKMLVERFLKTKCYEDTARDTKTIIYYDIIPVDAQPKEQSIYYNEGPFVKEEGSDPVIEIEHGSAIKPDELPWVG